MVSRRFLLSAAVAAIALATGRPSRAGTRPPAIEAAAPSYTARARWLLANSAMVWVVRYPACQPEATHDIYDTEHPVVFVPVPKMPAGDMTIEAVRGVQNVDYLAGVLDLPRVVAIHPTPLPAPPLNGKWR